VWKSIEARVRGVARLGHSLKHRGHRGHREYFKENNDLAKGFVMMELDETSEIDIVFVKSFINWAQPLQSIIKNKELTTDH